MQALGLPFLSPLSVSHSDLEGVLAKLQHRQDLSPPCLIFSVLSSLQNPNKTEKQGRLLEVSYVTSLSLRCAILPPTEPHKPPW